MTQCPLGFIFRGQIVDSRPPSTSSFLLFPSRGSRRCKANTASMPPFRIAVGSCSHPSLPQHLWSIVHQRHPAAFVWGGDAIYADRYSGLNWTAVGLAYVAYGDDSAVDGNSYGAASVGDGNIDTSHAPQKKSGEWRFTFPPPSIHIDATPEVIRKWYQKQWNIDSYRQFVEGWDWNEYHPDLRLPDGNNNEAINVRPLIFGTIDDHDYGANNGDLTYRYKRESNLEFLEFIYSGVDGSVDSANGSCNAHVQDDGGQICIDGSQKSSNRRNKHNDPMYQRAIDGKGVFGVQLFDFASTKVSPKSMSDNILWGGGYWIPEEEALIDPDVIAKQTTHNDSINATQHILQSNYSTTHSVAIFVLDVRSNKTPWPKGKHHRHQSSTGDDDNNVPVLDFLGEEQWKWFQSALSNSKAAVNLIVSGLQVHPERFPNDGNIVEEWSKFPESQAKLYNLILNSGVKSPILVSGDVHMSQILRKDCIRSSDIPEEDENSRRPLPTKRPLVEVTTSGMTHSWGTSFSSQPKHHTLPLWPYSYFVSRTFMTICHFVCPWRDLVIRTDDMRREEEAMRAMQPDSVGGARGKVGKQYDLGLNFGEFEFQFNEEGGGVVSFRVFGKGKDQPPKLQMTWSLDQLSGKSDLAGMTAKYPQDFLTMKRRGTKSKVSSSKDEWICVPYRGIAPALHEYTANAILFVTFCSLFFSPHVLLIAVFVVVRRRWTRRKEVEVS